MNNLHNPYLTPNSKILRKNMTRQEKHLWYDFLRFLPVTIHRQKVIGNYIVDFYCASAKIVIELDGSQHYDNDGIYNDNLRDDYLNKLGITVLRYSNLDVDKNFNGVCEDIQKHLNIEQE